MNHLSGESSPYLRLHAPNPVEWYPWSEEAFARARAEDKPIFLSIGYYTCHWCHVMERESFSSPAVAELLSRDFISIKVDREERPDVDRLYMAYVQATTGGGGWPLSAFLTPELKPFYGGTYFPPRDLQNVPSFRRVLQSVAHAWREQRGKVMDSAAEISGYLAQSMQPQAAGPVPATAAALLEASWPRLWENLRAGYDREAGGFGGAPKFPRPAVYHFLLRFARRQRGRPEAKEAIGMVTHTLRAMASGGIHDALGGGFHRYAVDANWRVPHFEKMLYDQAQLATAYLEAWQVTHEADLGQAARSTLDYVLREMTAPEGGFYSAEDADSPLPEAQRHPSGPGEGEGAYYLWTQEEILRLLDAATAQRFIKAYGVRPEGNVPASLDPQGEFAGKNILYGAGTPELEAARAGLYQARRQRPHPPRDEKVLAAWNGLMISALALGARALDTADAPRYLAAARGAAGFFRTQRWHAEAGELRRTPAISGFVEDYAFLIQGLLDLYQADFDPGWLEWAAELQRAQDARFAAPGGGYYSSAEDPHLWMRMREEYDGAEPSPNSVAARNLQRLSLWFERDGWRDAANQLLASFAQRLEQAPETLPLMTATLEAAAVPPRRLLIAGAPQAPATNALLRVVRQKFLPEYDVMLDPAANAAPAAYLCRDYTCQRPVTDADALEKSLELSAE